MRAGNERSSSSHGITSKSGAKGRKHESRRASGAFLLGRIRISPSALRERSKLLPLGLPAPLSYSEGAACEGLDTTISIISGYPARESGLARNRSRASLATKRRRPSPNTRREGFSPTFVPLSNSPPSTTLRCRIFTLRSVSKSKPKSRPCGRNIRSFLVAPQGPYLIHDITNAQAHRGC
jgi:hypothetical protein